jgi:hypothetical protein
VPGTATVIQLAIILIAVVAAMIILFGYSLQWEGMKPVLTASSTKKELQNLRQRNALLEAQLERDYIPIKWLPQPYCLMPDKTNVFYALQRDAHRLSATRSLLYDVFQVHQAISDHDVLVGDVEPDSDLFRSLANVLSALRYQPAAKPDKEGQRSALLSAFL